MRAVGNAGRRNGNVANIDFAQRTVASHGVQTLTPTSSVDPGNACLASQALQAAAAPNVTIPSWQGTFTVEGEQLTVCAPVQRSGPATAVLGGRRYLSGTVVGGTFSGTHLVCGGRQTPRADALHQ